MTHAVQTIQTADAYDVDQLATFLERHGIAVGPAFVIAGYMLTGQGFLKPLTGAMRAAFPAVSANKVFAVARAARDERDALRKAAVDRAVRSATAPHDRANCERVVCHECEAGYTLPAEAFAWKAGSGSAFASSLGLRAGDVMYEFGVVGKRATVRFQLARTDYGAEGDVIGWAYIAPGEKFEVVIFND